MDVLIIETETGRTVARIPVILQGMNYTPSEQEYFDLAWRNAVDDETVDEARRDAYSFRLIRPK